ncbi:TPA: hypothetical protein ACX6PR_003955 [Photobacterium damselae]
MYSDGEVDVREVGLYCGSEPTHFCPISCLNGLPWLWRNACSSGHVQICNLLIVSLISPSF